MDNLLSFFPEIWKIQEFSVPLVIPFRQMLGPSFLRDLKITLAFSEKNCDSLYSFSLCNVAELSRS